MGTIFRRGLSVFLAAAMTVTLFSGCSKSGSSESSNNESSSGTGEGSDVIAAEASAVDYRSDGKYTTEITVEGASFAGITADDVEVRYPVIDYDGLNAALSEAENADDVDTDEYMTNKSAAITELTVKDDKTVSLSFTDENAADNFTDVYGVYFESRKIGAGIPVQFTDFTLTPEMEYVLATDKDIRLTLALDEGEFAADISKDDIGLRGSFEEMQIESLSSAGKNLTMQLTGGLVMHEGSGVYLDGFIDVYAGGIVNSYSTTSASVPVQTEAAYFVTDGLTVSGGSVTVPLVLIDVVDTDALTKDSFVFENGVTVTDCVKDSDTQVTLTVTVDGAADKNSAAAALNGQTVRIGNDYEFIASFTPAAFYPVFDYVEEDGDNLKFTLELYANSGTFADGLSADMFSFGFDFDGASSVSVEKTGDTTAELIFSVPANGQTPESLDMDGEVTAAAGALINRWGDAPESETAYMRNYSQDSMGKDYNMLSGSDIDAIKKIVGGFGNTTFGTLTSIASGAMTGYNAVKTILEMTGVIKSEHAQVMEKLDKIEAGIGNLRNVLDYNTGLLEDLQVTISEMNYTDFETDVDNLISCCKLAFNRYSRGEDLFKNGYDIKINGVMKKVFVPKKNSSESEWNDYYYAITQAMLLEDQKLNPDFMDFRSEMQSLAEKYRNVANKLKRTGTNNPIYYFDQYCTRAYNFDSTAYPARAAFRAKTEYALKAAYAYLRIYYNQGLPSEYSELYVAAANQLAQRDIKLNNMTVRSYVTGIDFNKNGMMSGYAANYTFTLQNRNFSDTEINSFIRRMAGKTMKQEIEAAGLRVVSSDVGVAFSWRKTKKETGFWDFYEWETINYYAKVIKWNSNKVEEINTYYKHWEDKYLWYKEVNKVYNLASVRRFS